MTMQPSYLDRAISSELRTLTSSKGGRNNQLFKSAAALYRFSEAGVCSEDVIEAELYSAASALGLQRDEIRDTLRSGRRRAAQLDQSTIDDIRAKCSGDTSTRPRTERPAPAPEACEPPCAAWRAAGGAFALFAQQQLHAAPHALDYLRGRGLTDKTIHAYGLGYNPAGRWSERAKWGIARDESKDARYPDHIWLPQGIVIPQRVDGVLWKIEIRQDNPATPEKRYKTVTNSANVLAGADSLQPGKPFMLVEGPLDWLCVAQAASDLCGVGRVGTSGARRVRWLTRLALASVVLVALDADAPGDTASKYWLDALPNARRWRPYYADPAQMAQDGADVRGWVAAGLNLQTRRLDEFSTEIVGTADGAQITCLLWDDTANAVIGRYASEAAAIAEARRLCGVTL